MVEHRNVVNFFAGMDAADRRTSRPAPGSRSRASRSTSRCSSCSGRSTRGFTRRALRRRATRAPRRAAHAAASRDRPIDFSLFYFAQRRGASGRGQVPAAARGRAVRRRARLRGGVDAGAPLPRVRRPLSRTRRSPSAALAAITERVQIRAGSVRAAAAPSDPRRRGVGGRRQPLGRPRRHLVRLGLAAATTSSLDARATSPTRKKRDARRHRRRAAAVARRGASRSRAPTGKPVDVRTLPRPVQPELPIWLTAAGNPETFAQAGEMGANVLTHLLGQTRRGASREKIAALSRGAGARPATPGDGPRHADAAHLRRRRRRRGARAPCASR